MKFKRKKQFYSPPLVLKRYEVEMEQEILAGSVVNDINASGMKSSAQELEQIDASDSGFNHEWN
ncbi:MAG: hypothetical protein IJ753_07585 [Bacteroidales bacterium]|nr:hypothetical protein [Bacteroidales bacterium]